MVCIGLGKKIKQFPENPQCKLTIHNWYLVIGKGQFREGTGWGIVLIKNRPLREEWKLLFIHYKEARLPSHPIGMMKYA